MSSKILGLLKSSNDGSMFLNERGAMQKSKTTTFASSISPSSNSLNSLMALKHALLGGSEANSSLHSSSLPFNASLSQNVGEGEKLSIEDRYIEFQNRRTKNSSASSSKINSNFTDNVEDVKELIPTAEWDEVDALANTITTLMQNVYNEVLVDV